MRQEQFYGTVSPRDPFRSHFLSRWVFVASGVLVAVFATGCGAPAPIYFRIINHGPQLRHIVLHYPFWGDRTWVVETLPTGGEVTHAVFFHNDGAFSWTQRTADGRDLGTANAIYIGDRDQGTLLYDIDQGGYPHLVTNQLKRYKAPPQEPHPIPPSPAKRR